MAKPESAFTQGVNTEGDKATFSVVAADVTLAANATDILCITASPTKDVRITYVSFTADATGSSTNDLYLIKRTAANSGGTISNPSICRHDSRDPTPTAIVNLYSANPASLGTGTLVRGNHISVPATASPVIPPVAMERTFGNRPSKSVVLRAGTQEQFAVNWNGNAVPAGMSAYVSVEWTEEPTP